MKKIISLVLSFIVVMTVFAISGCSSSESEDKIVLGNFSYESCVVSNTILKIIFEQGYGKEVELLQVETASGMAGLERGSVSATSELWLDNRREWFNEVNNVSVVSLHDTYTGKVDQGWYVPSYVIEDCTDLKSVEDVFKYIDYFKSGETKGKFLNAPSGWNSSEITRKRFEAYGFSEEFELVDPGSGSGLDMTITSMYDKKLPFITYYWEPTWLLGTISMTKLEEAPYDESVWNEDNSYKCSYPDPIVKILANKEFVEKNFEIKEVLSKYCIETSLMNQILAKAQENSDSDYVETVKEFMRTNDWWECFVKQESIPLIKEYVNN